MTSAAADIVVTDVQSQQGIDLKKTTTAQINRYTFPHDFPAPPEGVTIISFSAWKERGICVEPRPDDPEELEVDTLGIPTLAMSPHNTDKCKTKTRRKKRKEEAKKKYLPTGGATLPWWVQWEENESVRLARPTNASDSRLSKFLAAAADFKSGRKWPLAVNSQIDPTRLWQMIGVFLGIEGVPKKAARPSRKKVFYDVLEGDDDDDDDDMSDEGDIMDIDQEAARDSDDEFAVTGDGKERKAIQFINNPERMVKIFLSSYARAKGIIWSKINLEQTPRLWIFFLEFLLRSRVLPRSEAGLRAALEVAKQALEELPLTGVLSASLPDEFSQGCRGCWGVKTEVFRTLDLNDDWLKQLRGDNKAGEAAPKEEGASADGVPEVVPEPEQNARDSTLKEESTQPEAPSWGDGWNTNESNGWGTIVSDEADNWGNVNIWDQDAIEQAALETEEHPWTTKDEDRPFLLRLLGPSLFPATHTTGIVEQSLRRITDLIPISTNIPPKPAVSETDPIVADPAAVEADLEKAFPKMVLSPWLNWDGGEMPAYSEPSILNTSEGPVVEAPYAKKTEEEAAAAATTVTPKAHDPGNDPITVLVHPSTFATLQKGMSFAGTWVQIVRQPIEPGSAAPPKKKKKGKKKAPANFWYLDELAGVFPSFWAVKS